MALSEENMQKMRKALSRCSPEQLLELNSSIGHLYRAQARTRDAQVAAQLHVGARVRFSATNMRPRYLYNQKGTVVEMQRTRVLVELDYGPQGKFRSGKVLSHPGSLTLLED